MPLPIRGCATESWTQGVRSRRSLFISAARHPVSERRVGGGGVVALDAAAAGPVSGGSRCGATSAC